MTEKFNEEEFLRLLGDFLANELSADDRDRFNELVRDNSEARRLYLKYMDLHSRLILDYQGGSAPEAMPGESAKRPSAKPQSIQVPLLVAAALIVSLFVGTLWRNNSSDDPAYQVENGVAVLSRALGIEWVEPSQARHEGDPLAPGPFRIASGLAQIEFLDGASVILEGPAELEIVSAHKAVFHRGRLRAFVPEPAQGFTIKGPEFDAVDLGTEFAMSVDPSGRSEIHVLDGEVAIHEKDGAMLETLTTGNAARASSGNGEIETIEGSGGSYVDREALSRMTDQRRESRYSEWRRSRLKLIDDPDTVVYFDFEDHARWDRQLRNTRQGSPNAAIVGTRWVSGRWPEKGALEFKRSTDRVRLHLPDELESMTLATWVRIEGLDRRYNSLFLTDGWDTGEPHWHIGAKGQLTFGIKDVGTVHSEPMLGPGDLGRWLHIAVTFEASSKEIKHYLDGEQVASDVAAKRLPIKIGNAEIGNWRSPSSSLRSFNGRFDEFLLSRRAFTAEEIADHFESGNPYQ